MSPRAQKKPNGIFRHYNEIFLYTLTAATLRFFMKAKKKGKEKKRRGEAPPAALFTERLLHMTATHIFVHVSYILSDSSKIYFGPCVGWMKLTFWKKGQTACLNDSRHSPPFWPHPRQSSAPRGVRAPSSRAVSPVPIISASKPASIFYPPPNMSTTRKCLTAS